MLNKQSPRTKYLAYLVLSSAIIKKNALKTLSRQINSPIIPKPARFEFKIQGTKIIENKEEFKELVESTEI